MGKPRRQTQTLTLTDLPNAIMLRIAENLPVKDLPNLASCCRTLAAMADELYSSRQVVDMSCFEPATLTPALCEQLIARFSSAKLHKLLFRYDIHHNQQQQQQQRREPYDDRTVEAIVGRFMDNVSPSNPLLLRDLRSGSPPTLHVLGHCYFLDRFLASQPCLRGLDVDVEVTLFTVLSSRGARSDWHLLNPFLTLHAVARRCPSLESYSSHASSYQMKHVDLLHLHVSFLQRCPKLRSASLVFVLGTEELATYARIRSQLALQQAVFYLPGWRVSPEQRVVNKERLAHVAARMDSLRKAVVSFRRRGCLADCRGFFTALPGIESLYLRCEFNPRFPVCDIDDGAGAFFGDVFSALKASPCPPRRLLLWGVPEDEFEPLFRGVLPREVTEIRVQLHWYSPNLDERRGRLLDEFLKSAGHLRSFVVAGVPPVPREQERQPSPVFVRSMNWTPGNHGSTCMFVFSGGKTRSSLPIAV